MNFNEKYMRRALQLAANGRGFTVPNPMVGAVIVAPDGRVIGEGWHRRCGAGHAEVNAVASVREADRPLLRQSTIYVTLEPCSHFGKTPPCARLLIDTGIPRVVVGAGDPNPKVNGRGIAMLREAGAEVITGVLADESRRLNHIFFRSQTLHRPFITLKWAQSADGFMDARRQPGEPAYSFSTPLARLATMQLRAQHEGILTTATTLLADNPRLNLRGFSGRDPRPFIIDRSGRLRDAVDDSCADAACRFHLLDPRRTPSQVIFSPHTSDIDLSDPAAPFHAMYDRYGITSVLVEAGPRYLSALIAADLWDAIRIETAPVELGSSGTHPAPLIPGVTLRLDQSQSAPRSFDIRHLGRFTFITRR